MPAREDLCIWLFLIGMVAMVVFITLISPAGNSPVLRSSQRVSTVEKPVKQPFR